VNEPAELLPAALARGLAFIDDPLLVARYCEGLAGLGVRETKRTRFHVDAAGFSPEVADELGDAFYLGGGALEARALIVGAAQLAAPLVHPGLGFAAEAWRRRVAESAGEIAAVTLREPLLAEIEPECAPLASPRRLADPASFEIRLRTPSGLVAGRRRLEAMKQEFLESERRWLEDDFIREIAELAASVRGFPALPDGFETARHRLGPVFFCPAFGGAYLIEEPGAHAASATTSVLAREVAARESLASPSVRGRRVELQPLTAASALEVLERHAIARVGLAAWRAKPEALERLRHWLAVDICFARDPERVPALLGAREVTSALCDATSLAPEQLELVEVLRRLGTERGAVDPSSLAPANRLRLALPTTERSGVRRFLGHLQAFLDPLDPGLAWRHAPDLFFARWAGLPAPRRAYLASWLGANAGALRREADAEG
jgi:hypothetical protein